MWAEIYDTDPNNTSKWVRNGQFTEVLDFPFQQRVLAFVTERTVMPLATLFNSDDFYLRKGVNVNRLGTFLGNHDMGRVGSFIGLNRSPEISLKQNHLAHALLFTLRGTPIVYYGDEFGLMGGSDKNARQDLFATEVSDWQSEKRIGMEPVGSGDSFSKTNPLQQTLRTLSGIRGKYPAFSVGSQKINYAGAGWLVFSRIDPTDGSTFLCVFNVNEESSTLELPFELNSSWSKITGVGSLERNNAQIELALPGYSWAIFRADSPLPPSTDQITLTRFRVDPLDNSRFEIAARLSGTGSQSVIFQYRDFKGNWQDLGIDISPTFSKNIPDNDLYRIFPDRGLFPKSGNLTVRAVVNNYDKEVISAERSIALRK